MQFYPTRLGKRYPPGATADADGVNFSLFSRHAQAVELLLYACSDSELPFQIISLDPQQNRSFFFWHVYVEQLPAGVCYTWRVDGPSDTRYSGFRFNRHKELLDPWARAVSDYGWQRHNSRKNPGPSPAMRAVVVAEEHYDWEGTTPLHRPLEQSIIYELHVGGFTQHPASGVKNPGTFAGLIEKIPYLQALGITDVELLPVMAFDEQDVPPGAAALGLKNFWGYSPHSFYSPHPGYCVTPLAGSHPHEFRDLIKALHKVGIGVILDVVFNHTAEGGIDGPTINFKGLDNDIYYHLDALDRSRYLDYSGCGNTLNCNHPLVTHYIVECLKYWVRDLHVDGFRFDLASILVRGEHGQPLYNAPAPWAIEFSRVLADTHLIAEAWDAGGLYQVGGFPGYRWAEWNGLYRDVLRRFVRGDPGLIGEVATRLSGSSDLYQGAGRLPINSINFITCHDGFTLYDLVSYNHKHNAANGEDNRDGSDDNLSWNGGAEGDTSDQAILTLRRQRAKNFMAILLLSQGVPMLLAGDEVLRSQRGNNNSYCQNNALGWFDWTLPERNADMLRFTREMIALRKRHPALMRRHYLNGEQQPGMRIADISWHGTKLLEPRWTEPDAQFIAYTLGGLSEQEADLHILLNMSAQATKAALPPVPGRVWYRAVDTSLSSPHDIQPPADQPLHPNKSYLIAGYSVVVLESRRATT